MRERRPRGKRLALYVPKAGSASQLGGVVDSHRGRENNQMTLRRLDLGRLTASEEREQAPAGTRQKQAGEHGEQNDARPQATERQSRLWPSTLRNNLSLAAQMCLPSVEHRRKLAATVVPSRGSQKFYRKRLGSGRESAAVLLSLTTCAK